MNNPEWHVNRVVLNKAFMTNSVFFGPMCRKVDLLMRRWEKEPDNVIIGHDLQKLTLDVLATTTFGLEFDTLNGKTSEPLAAYNFCIDGLFNPIFILFPWFAKIPLPYNRKLNDSLNRFDSYCWEVMGQTKKNLEEKKKRAEQGEVVERETSSIIELMYESNVPEKVIRDNVSLFFFAGHETTSSSLSWIVATIATNQEVQDKARKEVNEKIPELTYENLKDLPYIEGLIKETLRIYPGVRSISGRTVTKDTVLGHVRIPVGTLVIADVVTMAYSKKIWGDPLVMRPERWYAENLTKDQRNAWIPFSIGPRVCIGMNFSLLEQKIFLVNLLKRFKEIKLAPGGEIKDKVTAVINCPDNEKLIVRFVPN